MLAMNRLIPLVALCTAALCAAFYFNISQDISFATASFSTPSLNRNQTGNQDELDQLANVVQRRFRYLQNPRNCSAARQMVYRVPIIYGFAAEMHMMAAGFIAAYATNRTFIALGWLQSPFSRLLKPLSDTCILPTNNITEKPTSGVYTGDEQIVRYQTLHNPYMPPALPADMADILRRRHKHPFGWWLGQVMRYIFRPTAMLQDDILRIEVSLQNDFPMTGFQIRGTDKARTGEAAFFRNEQYMERLLKTKIRHRLTKKIYVGTDEPPRVNQLAQRYNEYTFVSNNATNSTIVWGQLRALSRDQFRSIVLDVYFLSMRCDLVVCTLSSNVCQLIYTLMQTVYWDARDRILSLDFSYSYCTQRMLYLVATERHAPRNGSGELNLIPGDILTPITHHGGCWDFQIDPARDGFLKGRCQRTNEIGSFSEAKVRHPMDIIAFHTYPDA